MHASYVTSCIFQRLVIQAADPTVSRCGVQLAMHLQMNEMQYTMGYAVQLPVQLLTVTRGSHDCI